MSAKVDRSLKMLSIPLLGSILIIALTANCCNSFIVAKKSLISVSSIDHTCLFASDPKDPELKGVKGMKGYYGMFSSLYIIPSFIDEFILVRPSRAIEKGGGFFIPGLEGGKVRLLSAIVLLVFFAINSSGLQRPSLPVSISTVTGILAAVYLFVQGVIETLPPSDFSASQLNASTSFLSVLQSNSASLIISRLVEKVVETVPTVKYLLVLNCSSTASDSNRVVYELGSVTQTPLAFSSSFSPTLPEDSYISCSFSEAVQKFPWLLSISSLSNQQYTTIVRPSGGSSLIWIIGSGNDLSKDENYLRALLSVPQ